MLHERSITDQTRKSKMTAPPLIDPALFDQLRVKIEEDTAIRKELDKVIDDLAQHVSFTQGVLSRIHSTPRSNRTKKQAKHPSSIIRHPSFVPLPVTELNSCE